MQTEAQLDQPRPWYKHSWPWMLIAIPFTSICVGSYFAYIASHGTDPMVQEQYYAAGQSINTVIAAGKQAQQMGLSATLTFAGEQVRLQVKNRSSEVLPPVVSLQLSHPTIASLDQNLNMVQVAPGQYSAALAPSKATRWDVTLTAPDKRWSLSGEWNRDEGEQVQLTPTDVRSAQD